MVCQPRDEEDEKKMCRAVRCRTCGKTTWAGCGMHVEQVMRRVATSQRCPGHAKEAGERRSMLRRLFSRD